MEPLHPERVQGPVPRSEVVGPERISTGVHREDRTSLRRSGKDRERKVPLKPTELLWRIGPEPHPFR